MPKESVDKIPKELLNTFEYKKDENYNFNIDENKSFEEQIILDETKAILANIFRDYWATPKQKEIIINKQNNDRRILEEQKRIKYNPDDIFKNKERVNLPIEIKKQNFFMKLIEFIKKCLINRSR